MAALLLRRILAVAMLAQVRLEQCLEKPPVVRDFQVQKLVDDDLVAEVGGLGQ